MQLKASKVKVPSVEEWGREDKITGKKKLAVTSCEQISY
jgi:hypothetical protein